ncbi:outer membrane autotransporter protein [Bartonella japonica]|uniref:Outer membrane autotransporter protein n=1 Tax=Bartonella japonica TaxID=357761 RepID=A0ABV2FPN1_9HYPH
MIKVFRNHVCLCTFTTAILSLLQNGVEVCAHTVKRSISTDVSVTPLPVITANSSDSNYPLKITVTPVPSGNSSLGGKLDYRSLGGEEGVMDEKSDNKLSGSNVNRPLSGMGGDSKGDKYVFKYSEDKGKVSLYDGSYYLCDACGIDTIRNGNYKITGKNVSDYPSGTAITVKGMNAAVKGEKVIILGDSSDNPRTRGVSVSENGKIILPGFTLKNVEVALYANNGLIGVYGGNIEESRQAVKATGNSVVVLENVNIETSDGDASLWSYGGAKITMKGGGIDIKNSHGVSSTLGGEIILDDVTFTGKGDNDKNYAVLRVDVGGSVNFSGTIDVPDTHGVLLENTVSTSNSVPLSEELSNKAEVTQVNIKSSSITVKGNGKHGIYFRGESALTEHALREDPLSEQEKTPPRLEVVNLAKTMFTVSEGVSVYSTGDTHGAVSLSQSTLSGRSLLKAEKGASLIILADASTMEGETYVDDSSKAELYLGAGSTWILQKLQQRKQKELGFINSSSVSHVTLMGDSTIKFTDSKPDESYVYQTLRIGNGTGTVYKAQDGAHIYMNTFLNEGGDIKDQHTDRLLIHGDVSGKTMVHVRGVSGSQGGYTGSGGNNQGISIIQVSGKADQNSFQLDGGYVTLGHSPYQYILYAYGPESDLGGANSTQRLVAGEEGFWDFRLENRYVDPRPVPGPEPAPAPAPAPEPAPAPAPEPAPAPAPAPEPAPAPAPEPKPKPEPGVKAVVPQVPTYLLLPNALFHMGLMDIGNQNKRLEALRIASEEGVRSDERPAFFVRGYGGSYRYSSNLSALEYGYGGELDYSAIEAGLLLKTIENAYNTTSLGIIGTYDRLLLQPLDVEQSQKSAFNKWSVTAYGGMQYHTGLYVDGLLSYGLFNGDVSTLARGETAKLKGKSLNASLTVGEALMAGNQGLVFDPQAQLIYQQLHFDKAHDIDDFDIDMGKLDQWAIRVGGRLTKTLTMTEEAHLVSLYGKLHFAHSFGGKQFVHFKDAFQLGAFGSTIEAGLGFNAQLSQKFALYGDLVYQRKITKAGFSGTGVSGGLRYHF